MSAAEKFNGLSNVYMAGRPFYADEFIRSLYLHYGFSKKSLIADIGSGTGKLAKQLLDKGSYVYCIEPNDDMRNMAEKELKEYTKFYSIKGNAENTTLNNNSVDFITAAQSFHWFNVKCFKKECKRILKHNGYVFLIWNLRDMSSDINKECFKIHSKYCPDFKGFGGGIQQNDMRIKYFYSDQYEYIEFDNPLLYDRERFINRNLSGSYSLKCCDKNYNKYINEFYELFYKVSKNNILIIPNKTVVYLGKLDGF